MCAESWWMSSSPTITASPSRTSRAPTSASSRTASRRPCVPLSSTSRRHSRRSPSPTFPPDTFSNLSSVPQSGPVTVILYDLLNTPLESQAFAHEQLLNFLRHRQSSSQVAIFVLTDKLHMLQGFTDDDNQLIAALNSQNGQRYKSSQLQAPGEATQQSDSLSRTAGNQNGADADQNASFQQVSTMLKHMETIESSALLDQRVRITVDALQEISRFLIAHPRPQKPALALGIVSYRRAPGRLARQPRLL